MATSKFNRNIKGRISSMANWSGGTQDEDSEEVQAFGEKLRQEIEATAAQVPVQEIELTRLIDNPYQYLAKRTYDDESMQELVDSIKSNGFYGALLARKNTALAGQVEIAYGHRRKEAARRAGLKSVPVKIVDLDDIEMARIMASENFSRLDLDPSGESAVIGFLADQQNLSAREISQIVGKKRGWVESRLALHNAPEALKQMVELKPDAFSHVPLLLRLKNDPEKLEALSQAVLKEDLTLQQLKERLDVSSSSATPKPDRKKEIVTNLTTSMLHGDGEGFHNDIVTDFTTSMLHGNSESSHNIEADYQKDRAIPVINSYGKVLNEAADIESGAVRGNLDDVEAQIILVEKLVAQIASRNPESLSWSIRARIQTLAQSLKELVGGD